MTPIVSSLMIRFMRLRVSVRFIFRDFWIVRLSDTRAPYTSLTQFYKTSRNRQSLPLHTENQPGMQRCERQVGASLSSSLFTFSTQPPPSHLVQYVQTSASPQKLWSVATVWKRALSSSLVWSIVLRPQRLEKERLWKSLCVWPSGAGYKHFVL